MMGLPNCVPEYYRQMEEEADRKSEKLAEAWESVQGLPEVGEMNACIGCDDCKGLKAIPTGDIYEPTRYFCKADKCEKGVR